MKLMRLKSTNIVMKASILDRMSRNFQTHSRRIGVIFGEQNRDLCYI